MDLRVQRTERNIINAFLELRAKKPIEKITIKELSELAFINKATFYTHYKDIYDLSEQLENEAIDNILNDLPHPEELILNPKKWLHELATALLNPGKIFDILFSGTRKTVLLERLESNIKNHIYRTFPEYKANPEKEILLTFLIQGSFHAFLNYQQENYDTVISILGNFNECLIQKYCSQPENFKDRTLPAHTGIAK